MRKCALPIHDFRVPKGCSTVGLRINNRDKNFTLTKVAKRMEQVDASIARYLTTLDRADREESDIAEAKTRRIKDKIAGGKAR